MTPPALYLGTKAHVTAIDPITGATLWRTKLKGGLTNGENFVSLLVHDGRVFAHTCGELFGLDPATGAILWQNKLEGLGYGLATLACEGATSLSTAAIAALQQRKSSDNAGTAGFVGGAS